jgi:hypothetical protein
VRKLVSGVVECGRGYRLCYIYGGEGFSSGWLKTSAERDVWRS